MAAVAALACVAFLSLALGSAELEIGTVIGAFSEFDGSTGHLIVRRSACRARSCRA